MRFFIDSADVGEIKTALSMGLVDGVTTNPSLLAKVGRGLKETIQEICTMVDGPISAEAVSTDAKGLIAEGRELSKINKNVVVKIPMGVEGLKAVKTLTSENIRTNVTLIFSPNQALLCAKAGATYVSPFIGRLDDIGQDGLAMVRDICVIFKNYNVSTQVLAASIRNPIHVYESAKMGAHVATIPLSVMKQLAEHPLTTSGIEKFLADWQKVPKG